MGYTHYCRRPVTLDPIAFSALAADVRLLMAHLPEHSLSAGGYHKDDPLAICGWDGTGEPEITDEMISFNGSAENELDHETFLFNRVYEPQSWEVAEKGRYFTCCKTARKPYDLLVTASLIRIKHHFPEVQIGSDGNPKDWIEGLKLCATVFGPDAAVLLLDEDEE